MLVYGSYVFSFILPASSTNTTSSIVMLVSAMLVDSTILRTPATGGAKMRRCSLLGMEPCSGRME